MKKSILQNLYDGQIYPSETITEKNNHEYKRVSKVLAEIKGGFVENLSDEEREKFAKIEELHYELGGVYSYEGFAHGFRLGVKLLIEVMNGDDEITLTVKEK